MRRTGSVRVGLAFGLVLLLVGGFMVALRPSDAARRIAVTAYFDNTNGLFVGDDVRILGVPVGKIERITPGPDRAQVEFWFADKFRVPADANAVILSPSLVTARAIQLTPAYTDGPAMQNAAVIPEDRTAVPVEWDDFRAQLQKLTDYLQPTEPGGVSTLGAFINTSADNLRGQGSDIRNAIIQTSQMFSAFGDHSADIFSTVKNLATLVSALQSSTGLMKQLNTNLAGTTALLSNRPNEIANAVRDLSMAVNDVQSFVAENRDTIGTTSDKLTSVSGAVVESLDDIKELLHVGPNGFQNFTNVYQPAQGAFTGIAVVNNFADPISFLCGAIQAASRLGTEQSAKLCVQYLAPIVKNRQYNFPPLGMNPVVGAQARPNELTYSEDWLRPDYVPPQPQPSNAPPTSAPLLAEQPEPQADSPAPLPPDALPTDPADGLQGMMVPPTGGP